MQLSLLSATVRWTAETGIGTWVSGKCIGTLSIWEVEACLAAATRKKMAAGKAGICTICVSPNLAAIDF